MASGENDTALFLRSVFAVAQRRNTFLVGRNQPVLGRWRHTAFSSGVVGGADIEGLLFRLETWAAGSGYVGNIAASDEVWVMQIRNALKDNWPCPPFDYIDVY